MRWRWAVLGSTHASIPLTPDTGWPSWDHASSSRKFSRRYGTSVTVTP